MTNPATQIDPDVVVRNAVTAGAVRYIEGCERRVDSFVQKHYSLRGALKLHTHAIGWDIVRIPLNIVWSVVNIVLALVGFVAGLLRLSRLKSIIRKIPPGIETDMDRQISWLVVTELLRLPHEQAGRRSDDDALMEEILKDPDLQVLLNEKLHVFEKLSEHPDFRERVERLLREYGATRTGNADLASNAALLITSKFALGTAYFGTLSAGTAVSVGIANSIAASNFFLGSTIGSYFYAVFPVVASIRLVIAVTAMIAVALALISTFIGIVTDPIQARLGLHQRRLKKLIRAIGEDLSGKPGKDFKLREKYVGRLFDLIDILSTVGRAV